MSTLHDRLSSSFILLRSHFKSGDDPRAFQLLERIVKSEIKKAKAKKEKA